MITCAPPGGGQTDRSLAAISDRNFRTEISGQTFGPKIPPEISAGIFPNCLSTGGSLKNCQKWHERIREGSIWPDPAGKRNCRTGRGHPDGFRAVKRPFRVGFSDFPPGAKRLKPAGGYINSRSTAKRPTSNDLQRLSTAGNERQRSGIGWAWPAMTLTVGP